MATYELDLHGLTWRESMKEFISVYNEAVSSGGEPSSIKITVIHGYGPTGEGGWKRNRTPYLDTGHRPHRSHSSYHRRLPEPPPWTTHADRWGQGLEH